MGGIAAGAKVVQGVAKGVKRGAQFAEMASCNSLFLDGNICFSDKHAVSINYMLDLCDPRQLIA